MSTISRRHLLRTALSSLPLMQAVTGQGPDGNLDESKVGRYTLPDPLVLANGTPVRDAATWYERRRPELLRLFETDVYGRSPRRPDRALPFELRSTVRNALGGKAVRKQVSIFFAAGRQGPSMSLLVYLPAAVKPAPMFVGLNFNGNHTVSADPGIELGHVWARDPVRKTYARRRAAESSRGSRASRWPLEAILARGYGVATACYGDIEPDFDGGIEHGIRPLFFKAGQTAPAADEWGAIGAWAWGLSRALDYLETDPDVDGRRVAVLGHSRLGKTALWAGAQDTRFAMVISNDSGEGGAALSRRDYGETIRDLNTNFPHWFCGNYKRYSGHADRMPVDQHELLALAAPRPLYIASAEQDRWADPRGEFLSAVAAGPVYRLLGAEELGTDRMPAIEQPIMHTVGYHVRSGKHDITAYDWEQYLAFADKNLRRR